MASVAKGFLNEEPTPEKIKKALSDLIASPQNTLLRDQINTDVQKQLLAHLNDVRARDKKQASDIIDGMDVGLSIQPKLVQAAHEMIVSKINGYESEHLGKFDFTEAEWKSLEAFLSKQRSDWSPDAAKKTIEQKYKEILNEDYKEKSSDLYKVIDNSSLPSEAKEALKVRYPSSMAGQNPADIKAKINAVEGILANPNTTLSQETVPALSELIKVTAENIRRTAHNAAWEEVKKYPTLQSSLNDHANQIEKEILKTIQPLTERAGKEGRTQEELIQDLRSTREFSPEKIQEASTAAARALAREIVLKDFEIALEKPGAQLEAQFSGPLQKLPESLKKR